MNDYDEWAMEQHRAARRFLRSLVVLVLLMTTAFFALLVLFF